MSVFTPLRLGGFDIAISCHHFKIETQRNREGSVQAEGMAGGGMHP